MAISQKGFACTVSVLFIALFFILIAVPAAAQNRSAPFFMAALLRELNDPDSMQKETLGKPVQLSIATGPPGSPYYALGGAIAQVVSKYMPNTQARVEATADSAENCRRIQEGKVDLAIVTADDAYEAVQGKGGLQAASAESPIQMILTLYQNYLHFVTLDGSGIKSIADLKGKRISTGAAGSATETMAMRILESYGIQADKDLKREHLGLTEALAALRSQKIDALAWSGGLSNIEISNLARTSGIRIKILNCADHLERLTQKYGPTYSKFTISKATYPNMESDVEVVVLSSLLIGHKKLEHLLVYKIIRHLIEHQGELVAISEEAKNISWEGSTPVVGFQSHAGALEYYFDELDNLLGEGM